MPSWVERAALSFKNSVELTSSGFCCAADAGLYPLALSLPSARLSELVEDEPVVLGFTSPSLSRLPLRDLATVEEELFSLPCIIADFVVAVEVIVVVVVILVFKLTFLSLLLSFQGPEADEAPIMEGSILL